MRGREVSKIEKFAWNLLFRTTTTHSLYLLGAGASDPEIDIGTKLSNEVRERFWANGIFPVTTEKTTPLKAAILRPDTTFQLRNCCIEQRELDALTPPNFVEVVVAQLLTRKDSIFPAQYRVFDLFYPSVIFNFNVDNLADRIHQKHEIHYPHMKIDPEIAHATCMQEAIDWLTIPPSIAEYFHYWRPIPEHPSITSMGAYHHLKSIFSTVHCVCIIGYSFGAWGGGLDDGESFELLTDLLRWKPKPVLVVNPTPQELIDRLEASIKQNVYGLCCKWNILAEFIITGHYQKAFQASGGSCKRITDYYLRFKEIRAALNVTKLTCGVLDFEKPLKMLQ